ncbi:MAG: hypothetical protein AAFX54_12795 [Pseudomonadota bacterium]
MTEVSEKLITQQEIEILPPQDLNNEISSYEVIDAARPLNPSEQLCASIHYLREQLNKRLYVPHLKDREGTPLGGVPNVIITIQSRGRAKGFAAKSIWSNHRGVYLDQITLIFSNHAHGDIKDLASTLVHEDMHAKQFHDGKPGSGNYHNRQFSDWMKSIGLQTSQTGKPGGAEIGTGMSDYIIEGGPFDCVMDELIAEGFCIPWETIDSIQRGSDVGNARPPRDRSKVKFTCPRCGQNAWAKSTAAILCGQDNCSKSRMISQAMHDV